MRDVRTLQQLDVKLNYFSLFGSKEFKRLLKEPIHYRCFPKLSTKISSEKIPSEKSDWKFLTVKMIENEYSWVKRFVSTHNQWVLVKNKNQIFSFQWVLFFVSLTWVRLMVFGPWNWVFWYKNILMTEFVKWFSKKLFSLLLTK